ncbi:MAG: hypothetical protein H7Z11_23385 [Verrucomicrobia bacterium]|nr:hypothetical protein [Leptolyngbya sp. ES-bin-22]
MLKQKIGRILLSVVLVSTSVVSVAVDWNASHIFSPEWVPHARFHDVAMLHLLCGVSIIGLWLLWRRSPEPEIGARVAALIPIIFWSAFFYTTLLVPGTSLNASTKEAPPQILGISIYPNVVIALISVILAALGYWLYCSGMSPRRNREVL